VYHHDSTFRGDSFVRPFRERHPNLVTRKVTCLEVDRMVEAYPTTINTYFNMLEKYLDLDATNRL
jgi:hypothetical protein